MTKAVQDGLPNVLCAPSVLSAISVVSVVSVAPFPVQSVTTWPVRTLSSAARTMRRLLTASCM